MDYAERLLDASAPHPPLRIHSLDDQHPYTFSKTATRGTRDDGPMITIGVKELRNCLSQYLRRSKQGEEIIVTERGKPIAVIQPIQSAAPVVSLHARLAKLAAQGRVTLPTRKPLKKVRTVKVSGPPISRTILEDRR